MTEAPAQASPLLQGRYRVEAALGSTRLATVYRATDERLQRTVLLHLLRKDLLNNEGLRQRFLAECQASAQRSHQALLEVFDSGEANGRPFMVSEYVAGHTLRSIGSLSPDDALLYLRQLTGAVAACQQQGLQYPSISSNNVLLIDAGRVKLLEYWAAPSEGAGSDVAYYRPPERARGEPPSAAGAVYSLGVLLLEALSGVRPSTGSAAGIQRLPLLAALRPAIFAPSLQQLLDRATDPLPAQRISDAAAFAQALDTLRSQLLGTTQQLSLPAHPPLGDRLRQAAATLRPPTLAPLPAAPVVPPPIPATSPPARPSAPTRRRPIQRGWGEVLRVWAILLTVVGLVAFGGWWLANAVSDRIAQAEAPPITLPNLPSLPTVDWRGPLRERLPEWLRWAVPAPEVVLVVNAPVLNMRPTPGTANQPLTQLQSGAQVVLVEGPLTLDDGSQWVQIRALADGQQGWVNLDYLRPS